MRASRVFPSLLPGFGPALGVTLLALSLVVLAPLSALLATSLRGSPRAFLAAVTTPRVAAAIRLSFVLSLAAAAVAALLGLLLGWVLVRYRFPGRRLLDAVVDLPFALPTAVAAKSGLVSRNVALAVVGVCEDVGAEMETRAEGWSMRTSPVLRLAGIIAGRTVFVKAACSRSLQGFAGRQCKLAR